MFSVLFSFWTASFVAFNGDALRERASQFLTLAEKRGATVPIMIGHRIMGSVLHTGAFVEGRTHLDRALALYDRAEHRSLATRFGQDVRVAALSYRSLALWMLGYPDAALADASHALEEAREIGQAATLMYALVHVLLTNIYCGNTAAIPLADELVTLAEEKGSVMWKGYGMMNKGCLLALSGKASDAIQMITSGITTYRRTGSTARVPLYLAYLTRAYLDLGQFDDAWRYVGDAMTTIETTRERWVEAEVDRVAGELVLKSVERDGTKAEAYFESALEIARQQQAKSWELRAAMSMARLWQDQGKAQQARELLAPVYGWFTEGFDTRDLKEAKTLLDALAA